MKTFGRRMQAKQFCDIQRAPAPVDDLTQEELQSFRCRDGAGRLMPGVYGAMTGARSMVLARTKKLGCVDDAGSTLGGVESQVSHECGARVCACRSQGRHAGILLGALRKHCRFGCLW